jgi:NTE family protein
MVQHQNIGLTLSGGGIRGMAHLGVLEYLLEIGIEPSIISGTSAGALVGVFYAAGYSPKEILEIGKKEKIFGRNNRSKIRVLKSGLFSPLLFDSILSRYLEGKTFEDLKIPVHVVATDLTNAKEVVFDRGEVITATKASASVPLVFEPVSHNGLFLCDGGLINNFPTKLIREKCDVLIGVNVTTPDISSVSSWNYKNIVERIIRISISNTTVNQKDSCDVYIEPPSVSQFGTFDYSKADEIFNLGYDYAKDMSEHFNQLI